MVFRFQVVSLQVKTSTEAASSKDSKLQERHCERNKYHLWSFIFKSFHFGSDHQAEVLLHNFTLKQFKALDLCINLCLCPELKCNIELWVFRSFSQIQSLYDMPLPVMNCFITLKTLPTHKPPNAQELRPAVLKNVLSIRPYQ